MFSMGSYFCCWSTQRFSLKTSIAGTQRWIDLGFFRLQPSEPAKLALVIVLASYFSRQEIGEGFGFLDLIKPGLLTGGTLCPDHDPA